MENRRRPRPDAAQDSTTGASSPWIMTFADLCTLLLVFFVMILSMSSLNVKAFRSTFMSTAESRSDASETEAEDDEHGVDEAIESIRAALGERSVAFVEEDAGVSSVLIEPARSRSEADIVVHVRRDVRKDAFTFVLLEDLLFDPGRGALTEDGRLMLAAIGAFAKDSGQMVLVDHFDAASPVPAAAARDGLSRRKAMLVLDYLISESGVEPRRMGVGAYGAAAVPLALSGGPGQDAVPGRTEITFENK